MKQIDQIDQIDRRLFLKKSGLVGAAAAGAAATATSWYGLAPEASAATRTCRWGSLVLGKGAQSQMDAVKVLEQKIGRRFDTTHYRMPWTAPLVNQFTSWSANTGHTQILSWFARGPGGLVSWRGIANGDRDAWITQQARALKATGWKSYFCFHKEPEDEGNPTDWKAAYNRVHQIFDNVGVNRMVWVVALMASTYQAGKAEQWMPKKYDLLGVDGANRYHCRSVPWKSFGQVFGGAHNYAQAKGKKLYIVESGCVEGEPGRKAAWFTGARATLKAWPEVVGFSYLSENTDCTYWADSTPSSLQAFTAMGRDSFFR
jgi:hypothetical protein